MNQKLFLRQFYRNMVRFIAILLIGVLSVTLLILPSFAQSQDPNRDVYIFVQTFVRNSDGVLVHYFENDKFTDKNLAALNAFLDMEASRGNAPTYDLEGKKFQLIQRSKTLEINSFQLVASTKLEDSENPISPFLVRYAHDGFFLYPGDKTTQVWTFFRQI
jgi:hypothetical protein